MTWRSNGVVQVQQNSPIVRFFPDRPQRVGLDLRQWHRAQIGQSERARSASSVKLSMHSTKSVNSPPRHGTGDGMIECNSLRKVKPIEKRTEDHFRGRDLPDGFC